MGKRKDCMTKHPAQKLIDIGQSVWYDNISRELIESGALAKLLSEKGVRGLTSNPTIFDNAISKSSTYDDIVRREGSKGSSTDKIFEAVAIGDIADAADILLPVFKESGGVDGFVSIEVSPILAADTKGTIEEARRLHSKLARPTVMIKVPGTPEVIPAHQI